MPPLPGEEPLLTLFADVHYFFSAPTAKPVHHRFDKGSYLYLYKNAQGRGRVEIANNAGTPDQDAFDGYLDDSVLQYSYKHDTLFTVTVDGRSQGYERSGTPGHKEPHHWHLPTADQNNQGKYMFPINTIDIYLWTKEDSLHFLENAKKAMLGPQLRILDAPMPPATPQEGVSSVVQNLENVAITDPSYAHRQSVSMSTNSKESPTAATPSQQAGGQLPPPPDAPQTFAPLAYNPSAPAAPEPIAHREKTPPPPEGEQGTGLAAAAMQDHLHQQNAGPPGGYQAGLIPVSPAQQQPYQGGPPQQQFAGPPGQQQQGTPAPAPSQNPTPGLIQRKPTTGSIPSQPSLPGSPAPGQPYTVSPPPNQQAYGQPTPPPPQQQPYGGQYGAPPQQPQGQPSPYGQPPQQFGAPPQSTTPQYGNYAQSPPPQQTTPSGYPQATLPPGMAAAATPPVGGFAPYVYPPQGQGQPLGTGNAYAVHQQHYRPTQSEAQSHSHAPGQGAQPSKLQSHADKLEKGVGRFLKKVEKKIG